MIEIEIKCYTCGEYLEVQEEYTSYAGNIVISVSPCDYCISKAVDDAVEYFTNK